MLVLRAYGNQGYHTKDSGQNDVHQKAHQQVARAKVFTIQAAVTLLVLLCHVIPERSIYRLLVVLVNLIELWVGTDVLGVVVPCLEALLICAVL